MSSFPMFVFTEMRFGAFEFNDDIISFPLCFLLVIVVMHMTFESEWEEENAENAYNLSSHLISSTTTVRYFCCLAMFSPTALNHILTPNESSHCKYTFENLFKCFKHYESFIVTAYKVLDLNLHFKLNSYLWVGVKFCEQFFRLSLVSKYLVTLNTAYFSKAL